MPSPAQCAAAPVQPCERNEQTTPPGLNLSRPQKRRRRLQVLAAHKAITKMREGEEPRHDMDQMCKGALEARLASMEILLMQMHWHFLGQWMFCGDSHPQSNQCELTSPLRESAPVFVPSGSAVTGSCPVAASPSEPGPSDWARLLEAERSAAIVIQRAYRDHHSREARRGELELADNDSCSSSKCEACSNWEHLVSTSMLVECKLPAPHFKKKFRPLMSRQAFEELGMREVKDYDLGVWFKLSDATPAAGGQSVACGSTCAAAAAADVWSPEQTLKFYKMITAKYRDDESLSPSQAVSQIAAAMASAQHRIAPEVYAILRDELNGLQEACRVIPSGKHPAS